MTAPAKLAAFAVVLAALMVGGAALGGAIDPDRSSGEPAEGHGGAMTEMADHPVRGVAVSEGGLRLVLDDAELARDRTEQVSFRSVDDEGATVRDFDVAHTKRMHVIVARRDLTGFQHLHPAQADDGSWTLPVRIAEAGSYRLFADFERDGEKSTLATDLRVDGPADLRPLPAPAATTTIDGGYDVTLAAEEVGPDAESHLDFTVTKDGQAVETEPYLGAGGHLVALREGDMAFLHVHPTDEEGVGISFGATFPTLGRYRLFLQFKNNGRIQTAAFTQEVQ
jgi:hypothetical protein